jgi:ketosteroid isomerase-like protein
MQTLISITLAIAVLLFTGIFPFADAVAKDQATAVSTDETMIRAARERFNQAIEKQDVEAIVSFLLPEYHIVTGRSDQTHGRENEAQLLKRMFADDQTFVCHRATREVRVNDGWGLAEELGSWRCDYTVDAKKIHSSGVYAAKWQRTVSEQWLLQSEVFTTLQCHGSEKGCRPPDPIE